MRNLETGIGNLTPREVVEHVIDRRLDGEGLAGIAAALGVEAHHVEVYLRTKCVEAECPDLLEKLRAASKKGAKKSKSRGWKERRVARKAKKTCQAADESGEVCGRPPGPKNPLTKYHGIWVCRRCFCAEQYEVVDEIEHCLLYAGQSQRDQYLV